LLLIIDCLKVELQGRKTTSFQFPDLSLRALRSGTWRRAGMCQLLPFGYTFQILIASAVHNCEL
jgi:hypothetical protein